jgi:hypothetical protein
MKRLLNALLVIAAGGLGGVWFFFALVARLDSPVGEIQVIDLCIGAVLGIATAGVFDVLQLPRASASRTRARIIAGATVCVLAGGSLIAWHRRQLVERERLGREAIERASRDAQAESRPTEPERTTVDALVEQLVSPDPPKHPDLYNPRPWAANEAGVIVVETGIHPRVNEARERLVAMGTDIYPELAEHIDDDRYSYSFVSAAWLNQTVGDMIARIMADGIEPHVGSYKSRENPKGNNYPPSFDQMVREGYGYRRYAFHAKERSKPELQREYVRWHIARERDNGFIDKKQEQLIIGDYVKILEED